MRSIMIEAIRIGDEEERRGERDGNTNNPGLHNLAVNKPELGIIARGAENYSKPYEALLKELGFSGKTTTLEQVLDALQRKTAVPLGKTLNYDVKAFLRVASTKLASIAPSARFASTRSASTGSSTSSTRRCRRTASRT
jgi:hypothetical protein